MRSMTVFHSDSLQVDYFFNKIMSSDLVITFTERTNRTKEGYGFAGELLKSQSIDFISIKSIEDNWYVQLDTDVMETVQSFVQGIKGEYRNIITYGSSMGGYAAFKFANLLGANKAVAISPIYTLLEDWETRWNDDVSKYNIQKMSSHLDFNSSISYYLIYDDKDADARHAELYKNSIPTNLISFSFSFSGHPSSYFLKEVGVLKTFILSLFQAKENSHLKANFDIPAKKHRESKTYLFWLGQYLIEHKKKFKSALKTNNELMASNTNNAEYHIQRAKILFSLGLFDSAIEQCDKATSLNPSNPHYELYKKLIIQQTH